MSAHACSSPRAWSRRALLSSLVAASACAKPLIASIAQPSGPIALGWRLLPGNELTLTAAIRRTHDTVQTTRHERWSLRVMRVDVYDIAHLSAWRTAIGLDKAVGDEHASDALLADAFPLLATTPDRAALTLGLDVRLHALDADTPWPLLGLALRLPRVGALLQDDWPDPDICDTLARPIPAALPTSTEGRTRLVELGGTAERPHAMLLTRGRVRTRASGPTLTVEANATWDAAGGRLLRRALSLRYAPQPLATADDPGALAIAIDLA